MGFCRPSVRLGPSVLSGSKVKSDKNVSRETVLSDWGLKPYKGKDSSPHSICKIGAKTCPTAIRVSKEGLDKGNPCGGLESAIPQTADMIGETNSYVDRAGPTAKLAAMR